MSKFLSKKNPLFFVAEIGGNHEGEFEYAKRLTQLAIDSGADAVKHQIYSGDKLVSRVESPDRNLHFKKFELTREQYITLAEMCREADTIFMASVWDIERLAWANPYITIHKVGSGDVTAFPLIKYMVGTNKPIILSTGLCTLDEVRRTVEYIRSLNQSYIVEGKLALLQCTTAYPCPAEDTNLNAIPLLKDEFGLPVGYSDHTLGTDAALSAAIMGAEILEMHFTDDRKGKTFRDHFVSITLDETRDLLERIRKVKILQGSKVKKPTPAEIAADHVRSFRRSIYASRPIAKGELLTNKNLAILRPARGIPANEYDTLLGRTATRDIKEHELIRREDVA